MHFNVFIPQLNNSQTVDLESNNSVDVFVVLNNKESIKKTVKVILRNNNKVNIYCLILGDRSLKEINLNLVHKGDNSISNIYVKALANHASNIKVNCFSSASKKTSKNEINQMIDGLMFDDKSTIKALPCLDINIDNVIAKHTVNVGQIDPEIIFYLNSKGLSKTQAYQFLIDSFISNLKPYVKKYNVNILEDINKIMGA